MSANSCPEPPLKRGWTRLLVLAALAGTVAVFYAAGGERYLRPNALVQHRDALLAFAAAHYGLALSSAILVYTLAASFSVPASLVLSLLMGMVFGRWIGTLGIVFSATLGASVAFTGARYLFADAARKRLGPMGKRMDRGFSRNSFSYVLFLRLVPAFPFFLVNLASAFTSISLRTFAAATLVGITPGAFVYANLGRSLAHVDTLRGVMSTQTLAALSLLGVLSLAPAAVKTWRARNRASDAGL